MRKYLFLIYSFLLVISCNDSQKPHAEKKDASAIKDTVDLKKQLKIDTTWRYRFDFDGDAKPDKIKFFFTGGAHCCYQLTVYLTKNNNTITLPFFIDGGYMIFDLSEPENFNIADKNQDNIAEIYINLGHYKKNRSEKEIRELQSKYHFSGTKICIELKSGSMTIKDQ